MIETFFDENTYTLTYLVYDSESKDCLIIDPVLDLTTQAVRFHKIV